MTTEVVCDPGRIDLSSASLSDLAAIVQTENGLVRKTGFEMVKHMIACGKALEEAKRHFTTWQKWLDWVEGDLNIHRRLAYTYTRCAAFEERVLEAAPESIVAAQRLIKGLPHGTQRQSDREEKVAAAEQLKSQHPEVSYTEIAELLDVKRETVYNWFNRDAVRASARRCRARRKAEHDALRRQERDRAARRAGGSISEAYSLLRRCAQQLDAAHGAANPEARVHVSASLARVHAAEDELVKALGVE